MLAKILRTLIGIFVIPIAIGTFRAFYTMVSDISAASSVLRLFERGVLSYLIFHVVVIRPVFIYIIGHELVHVLATWISGGRIISFSVKPSGGSVVTSKTNFFIELSPYFVPIYTIFLAPIFLSLRPLQGESLFMPDLFIFLVGVTLAFHFAMTSEALRVQQPDIVKSGILFSYLLIFVGNLVIVMAVFSPLFENLSFINFSKAMFSDSIDTYRIIYEKSVEFISTHKVV